MYTYQVSLKSETVGFKFSVILGDLTRNDPNISGGSWGLGALGPAILWGPLQRVSAGGLGAPEAPPPSGVRGRAPEAKHFGNNILKIG